MSVSQVIQPTQQSQVATKAQRGQLTSFLVIDDQQAGPSRFLTFTLTPTKHFNPPSVASAIGKVNTTYQDFQASSEIYPQC